MRTKISLRIRNVASHAVIAACLLGFSCARKVPIATTPALSAAELLYNEGLAAFRESTKEGYARSVDKFRNALQLDTASCPYATHLAESLVFLALEKKRNWEDYARDRTEARQIVDSKVQSCAADEAYILRIRALASSPLFLSITSSKEAKDLQSSDMVSRGAEMRTSGDNARKTVQLDSTDPMNWLVLWMVLPSADGGSSIVRAAELDPNSVLIQYELGNYHLARGRYSEARQAFERALAINPAHYRAMIGLAYSIASNDPMEDVESFYKKASEVAPDYLEARDLLGNYYLAIEEVDLAIEQFRAEVQSNPTYYPGFLSLGLAYMHVGRLQEAENAFHKTMELEPSNPDAQCYLGDIRLQLEDLEDAKRWFAGALQYRVNFAEAFYGLGVVMYRQGNAADAIGQFNQAIKYNAQYAEAYMARAVALPAQQSAAAVNDLERAIEIYQREAINLEQDVEKSEAKGLFRKATGARNRISGIQKQIENARGLISKIAGKIEESAIVEVAPIVSRKPTYRTLAPPMPQHLRFCRSNGRGLYSFASQIVIDSER